MESLQGFRLLMGVDGLKAPAAVGLWILWTNKIRYSWRFWEYDDKLWIFRVPKASDNSTW
jgi:hypothetical protein